jgi:hypothetical protein
MATPRESGPAYEVQALRLTVQTGMISDADIVQRVGQLGSDLVAAMTQALHAWQLPFIAGRAEQLGDEIKAKIGVNPLDVDDGGTPPLPADLFAQTSSPSGELASDATLGGSSQSAASAAGSAINDFVGKIGATAMLLVYAVILIAVVIGGAYAYKVARK